MAMIKSILHHVISYIKGRFKFAKFSYLVDLKVEFKLSNEPTENTDA